MSERIAAPDYEQPMLGGLLAAIKDYRLDFESGELEDYDIDDMVGAIVSALEQTPACYSEYEEGHELDAALDVLIRYGVLEDDLHLYYDEEEDDEI